MALQPTTKIKKTLLTSSLSKVYVFFIKEIIPLKKQGSMAPFEIYYSTKDIIGAQLSV